MNIITSYLLFLLSISATVPTQSSSTALTVQITNIEQHHGIIYIALYTEEEWLFKSINNAQVEVSESSATVILSDIPPGTYGISTYHDVNGNGKMDKGIFGIPKEPWACSRGAKGFMGPPKFKNAKFTLNIPIETIIIQY